MTAASDDVEPAEDAYGNPIDGDRLIYCCFPDCGCDGARLCMAEKGASDRALGGNVEGMWSGRTLEQRKARRRLITELMEETIREKAK